MLQDYSYPRDTIFVFDLHEVIITRDYHVIFKLIMKNPGLLRLSFLVCNPFFVYHTTKLLCRSRVPEEYITVLGERFPLIKKYKNILIDLMNAQKPVKPVIDLIQSLKQYEYKLYILSNIGEETFAQLSTHYDSIFALFDGIHMATAKNNWLHKPHVNFYQQFLERFTINPHMSIFIDNRLKNVKAAQYCGMKSILYTSAEHLIKCISQIHELRK